MSHNHKIEPSKQSGWFIPASGAQVPNVSPEVMEKVKQFVDGATEDQTKVRERTEKNAKRWLHISV